MLQAKTLIMKKSSIDWKHPENKVLLESLANEHESYKSMALALDVPMETLSIGINKNYPYLDDKLKFRGFYQTKSGKKMLADVINMSSTLSEIAEELGIQEQSARWLVKKYYPELMASFKIKSTKSKYSNELILKIKETRSNGVKRAEILDRFNLSINEYVWILRLGDQLDNK